MVNIVGAIFLCGLVLVSATETQDDILNNLQRIQQIRNLGLQFAGYLENVTLSDISQADPRAPTEEDLLCLRDLSLFSNALSEGQLWALKMIDSWGTIPSGILTGNMYDLGNYDECLNINKDISEGVNIRGKYCFLEASPSAILGSAGGAIGALNIKTATCFPASCSAPHMNIFVGQVLKRFLNLNISTTDIGINENSCQTSESEPWDGLTIFTVVLLSVMGAMVAVVTLYDYFFCKNQSELQLPAFVKAFSARANSRALFRIVDNSSNPNVIGCLNGIRCLSLFWVVFSHEYTLRLYAANINLFHAVRWAEQAYSMFIVHGFFSVDSFFFLGGLLVALISLRAMDRTKGKLNVPLMYLHRIIRIVPILAVAILVYTKLTTVLGDGPLFYSGYSQKEACENGWYWTLLFVNNYTNDTCLGHTWYLSVDMQMFVISPILLIALYKWGKKGAAGVFVFMVLLSGCTFATMLVGDYSMLLRNFSVTAMSKMYFATHTHAAPWLVGFLFGYFLHLTRGRKFKLSWVAVWSGWILCLAMIFTSIFALYPYAEWTGAPLSIVAESFYYTLTRVGWPLALCWVVFACMQGYGGLANSFLSSPLWQPLSRLSYSIYMWHMFIQEINTRSARTNSYFSNYQVMLLFWSDIGTSMLFAFLLYLIIEGPVGGLDNFLRPQKKPAAVKASKSQPDQAQAQQQVEENGPTKLKATKANEANPTISE